MPRKLHRWQLLKRFGGLEQGVVGGETSSMGGAVALEAGMFCRVGRGRRRWVGGVGGWILGMVVKGGRRDFEKRRRGGAQKVTWLEVGEAPKWGVLISVGDEDFGVDGKGVDWKHVDQVLPG